MLPEHPTQEMTCQLRRLWQEAFGDTQEYLDGFFRVGFSPENCLCIRQEGNIAAALYWLDMTCRGEKTAYIYAVATAQAYRGQGLCRRLMERTHRILKDRGYAMAVLVPQEPGLVRMYEALGYFPGSGIALLEAAPAEGPIALRSVGPAEYNARRNSLLPPGSVELGEQALAFLSLHSEFFLGEDFALAAVQEKGQLLGLEYLGPEQNVPRITAALGCAGAKLRVPGNDLPFAMYYPLVPGAAAPNHFGFAFD